MKRYRTYKGKKYVCDPYYSHTDKLWICTLRDAETGEEVAKESGYGMSMHNAIDDAFYKLGVFPRD